MQEELDCENDYAFLMESEPSILSVDEVYLESEGKSQPGICMMVGDNIGGYEVILSLNDLKKTVELLEQEYDPNASVFGAIEKEES